MPWEWLAKLVKRNFDAAILDIVMLTVAWLCFHYLILPGLAQASDVSSVLSEVKQLSISFYDYKRSNEVSALEAELRSVSSEIFMLEEDIRAGDESRYKRERLRDLREDYNALLRRLEMLGAITTVKRGDQP